MKVFELNHPGDEKEWIAANTNVEAILYYALVTGCNHHDLEGSTVIEVPEDKLDSIIIRTNEHDEIKDPTLSLKQWMGKTNPTSPEIIAGTMY